MALDMVVQMIQGMWMLEVMLEAVIKDLGGWNRRWANRAKLRHVYFARAESGEVKVGISEYPGDRVREVGYKNKQRYKLLVAVYGCDLYDEMAFHALLSGEQNPVKREHFSGPKTEALVSKILQLGAVK